MRFKQDDQYTKFAIYAFFIIALSIIFYQLLDNLGYFLDRITYHLGILRRILSPFIIGISIAYLLNPGVRWFEKSVYGKIQYVSHRKKLHRLLSVATVYLILASFITMIIVFVAPQIGNNIRDISRRIPEYINYSVDLVNHWAEDIDISSLYNITGHIENNIKDIFNRTSEILQYVLDNIIISIMTITSGVLNFILGFIISFYILLDKESFKIGTKRILRAFLNEKLVNKIKDFGREADTLFGKFIVGKSIDSFIIGCMCFVGLKIMDIRYALLISVIIGITNMIPYFGPFIGAVPAVIITFFDSPIKAIWVLLFIFGLQQFDGMILGPKILGDSVGVSPFWIILSIIVGGGLFGVLGMFLGVPIIAIIRILVNRAIDWQLKRKKISLESSEES